MDITPVLIGIGCAVLVVLIVVGIVVSVRRDRQRRAALQHWAAQHGWTYTDKPKVEWARRLPGTRSRGVMLMLSGVLDGYPVSVADYYYQTESTSTTSNASGGTSTSTSTTTHYLIVVVVRLGRPGPTVGVAPRHGLSKLGRAMFGDGKTALGHEQFDRAFKVSTKDPAAGRQLVGPLLAAEHLAGRVPAWSLHGADLLSYRQGQLKDPARIVELARPVIRVATLLGR
jgi:hypothetical protein